MQHGAFQLNKVRRLIACQGKDFWFSTPGKNEFGEPNGKTVSRLIKGVYHENTGFASGHAPKISSEATVIRKKGFPMVLTLWESVLGLHHEAQVKFNGKTYKVTEIHNVAEANLVANISLEEVQT